jgi:hypothetical protein
MFELLNLKIGGRRNVFAAIHSQEAKCEMSHIHSKDRAVRYYYGIETRII